MKDVLVPFVLILAIVSFLYASVWLALDHSYLLSFCGIVAAWLIYEYFYISAVLKLLRGCIRQEDEKS